MSYRFNNSPTWFDCYIIVACGKSGMVGQLISDNHNAAFVGKEVRVGEKTLSGRNNKGRIS